MIYYKDSKLHIAYDSVLMAVKTCSKAFLTICLRHGKSPCFSEVTFLKSVNPDYSLSILPCIDEQKI